MCQARAMRQTRSIFSKASHTPSEAISTRTPDCGTFTCSGAHLLRPLFTLSWAADAHYHLRGGRYNMQSLLQMHLGLQGNCLP